MEYEVKIIKSVEQVEELRSIWEKMQWHPNTDISQYLSIINSLTDIIRPHIILFSQNNQPKALAVGRLERRNMGITIGYKTFLKFKTHCLTIMYGGLLGDWSQESSHHLITELMKSLKRNEADIVWFNSLQSDSQIYEMARKEPNFFCRDHVIETNVHWKMILPNSYEEFLSNLSKRPRANLRNYSNRFNKKYGASISIKCFNQLKDIDLIFHDTEAIASKTYHRGLGAGFINDNGTYEIYKRDLNNQWLRAYIMYINGTSVAYWHGHHYGNTFFMGPTGFDPTYTDDRPGTILLSKIIDECCRDDKISSIDFGFGDAEYKRIYCTENWNESSAYIYAPTTKGILLNAIRTINLIPYRYLLRLAEKNNMLQKIKRLWRDKLIRNNNGTGNVK